VYGLTRKQAKDTELPDVGELQEGKFFRLAEQPPWLSGCETAGSSEAPETVPAAPPMVSPTTTETSSEVQPQPTIPVVTAPEPPREETVQPFTDTVAPSPPLSVITGDTLVISINRLNEQTVDQVFHFIREAAQADGRLLHLTDAVGSTLIPPAWGIRVDQGALTVFLNEYNLIADRG